MRMNLLYKLMHTFLLISLFSLFSCNKESNIGTPVEAEVILITNADIITMNTVFPNADSMAISQGRIIAIGKEIDVRASIRDYSRFFNLQGKTIVPGFFETHDHLVMSSITSIVTDVSPFTTPTLSGALEKIKNTKPDNDGWIIAFGADQELYKEKSGPSREMLDKLFPTTPVIVFHLSGHGGFANSVALSLAHINEQTPNPEGGFYEKDANGRLTGYLAGQSALFSVKAYPNPTPSSIALAADQRASQGITTSSEFAIMNAFVLDALKQATTNSEFPLRVVGGYFSTAPDFTEIAPRLKHYENKLLKIPFIKTWTDGSMQGGTASLSEPYYDSSMGEGGAQGTQDFFNKQVKQIYELGLWPAIHANGDDAVELALNAVEYAQKSQVSDNASIRPQLIHAQYTRPEQIERMALLKVSPTFFTTHVYYWGDLHFEKTLGPKRSQRLSAMSDAFDAKIHPSMHNDPPVSPANPLLNMWISTQRKSDTGKALGTDQAITAQQALEAYTINAAYQFGMEKDAGSLEKGKFADFVVLDKNPLTIPSNEIRNIHVLSTVLGGRVTYSDLPKYNRINPLE